MSARRYFRDERAVERRSWSCVDPRGTFDGEFVVHAYSIITTDDVVFNVWEAEAGHSSSFRSETFGRLGALRSRPLPPEIDALPVGPARTVACHEWFVSLDRLAEEIIVAAFPEVPMRRVANGEAFADLDAVNAAVAA